ncbi:MAG: mechanosensitive ion channel [Alphaproteobacteria bacterium]|nr:mechanosensitive ion channel [Alphaproteobacteria bacterium]
MLCTSLTALPVAAADSASPEPPARVRELLDLLADPAVQAWLTERRTATPPPGATADPAPEETLSGAVARHITMVRDHFAMLAAATPSLPDEVEHAWIILYLELEESGLIRILLLFGAFIVLGYGAEWLYWRTTTGLRQWISDLRLETVAERLRAVELRFVFGLGLLIAFALGSIGAFLAFDWPPLFREIVLGYLLAFLAPRLAMVVGRLLLAPAHGRVLFTRGRAAFRDVARFRVVPLDDAAASFWHWRLILLVAVGAFAAVSLELLRTLGFAPEARELVATPIRLLVLAIGLEAVWRRPGQPAAGTQACRVATATNWALTGYFLLLFALLLIDARAMFLFAAVVIALPAAIRLTARSFVHLMRPIAAEAAAAPSTFAVCVERGLRALLIIAAALTLAHGWGIELTALTAGETLATRLVRGALNAILILLVADLAWQIARVLIERTLSDVENSRQPNTEEARRRARLHTLLPILRNIILVVLVVMAGLMAMGALGIDIGPLIAGAGVVGVAIGFGAQTLVKDIISGMFYLLDDAFRIGEYIQSGAHKGTVESFSLRSVKLRHHRGPLTTIPFGELGAVQNMSRDWVIDKMTISVTYDTGLDAVKKMIKQVGKDLAADPEFAPHIIETLKMQGVEQFGDYAVQVRMKMITKPGEQFVIRRRAYALIKKAFDASGVKFAFPTVQVSGGGDVAAAAARQTMASAPPETV